MRKIIHCDCDCFYASVEMRDDASLRGRPIAVGGSPHSRGVIATCNYEARRYGIRSAMSSAKAAMLCPDLIIVKPDIKRYQVASKQIHEIMQTYTSQIEPVSLDEAYLDVTDSTHCNGSATLIAEEIRARVKQEVGITLSAGIAPNKFLAKVASDWNKPDGLFVVRPHEVSAFVEPLSVSKINGVGKVTAAKLKEMGVECCGDLQRYGLADLIERFGKYGERLYSVARGVDDRQVESSRIRKSVSVERTFSADIGSIDTLIKEIPSLMIELRSRCDAKVSDQKRVFKRFIKVKFFDFTQTTLEQKISGCSGSRQSEAWHSESVYEDLLKSAWCRGSKPVRLLGVGVRLAESEPVSSRQLSLL